MTSQIESDAKQATATESTPGDLRVASDTPTNVFIDHSGEGKSDQSVPSMSPVEQYIRAQHLFIEAQQLYIHKPDLRTIAGEQEAYISAQTRYIAYLLSQK